MATIRKHFGNWQVMIRRKGYPHISKSFTKKSTASTWAKQTELDALNDVLNTLRTIHESEAPDVPFDRWLNSKDDDYFKRN